MAPLAMHRSPVERSTSTSPEEVWYVDDRGPVEGVKGRLPGEPLTIVTGTDRLSPTSWLDQRLAYARTSNRSASLPGRSPHSAFGGFPRSPSGKNRKLVKPPPSPLIGSPIRSRLFGSLSRKLSGSGPPSAVPKMTSTASLETGIPTISRETWVVESASSDQPRPHETAYSQVWPHTAAGHPVYGAGGWPARTPVNFSPVEQGLSPGKRESFTLYGSMNDQPSAREAMHVPPSPLSGRGGGPRAPNRSSQRRPSVPRDSAAQEAVQAVSVPPAVESHPEETPAVASPRSRPPMSGKPSSASLHAAMRSSGTFGFAMGERRRSSSESAIAPASDGVSTRQRGSDGAGMRQRGGASSDLLPGNQLGLHDPPESPTITAAESNGPIRRAGVSPGNTVSPIQVNVKRPSAGSTVSRLSDSHPFSPTRPVQPRGSAQREQETKARTGHGEDPPARGRSADFGRQLGDASGLSGLPLGKMLGGGLGDLPLVIASHVLESHADSLARLSCSMGHSSAEINRLAQEAREWADSISKLAKSRARGPQPAYNCDMCDPAIPDDSEEDPRRFNARGSTNLAPRGSADRRASDSNQHIVIAPWIDQNERRASAAAGSRRNSWIVSDSSAHGFDPTRLGFAGPSFKTRPLSNISEQHSSLRRLSSVAPDELFERGDTPQNGYHTPPLAVPVQVTVSTTEMRKRPLSELPPRSASLAFNRHETPSWLQNMPPLPYHLEEDPRLQLHRYSGFQQRQEPSVDDRVDSGRETPRAKGTGFFKRISIFGGSGSGGKKTDKKSKRMTFSSGHSISPRNISSPIPIPGIEGSLFYEHLGPPPRPPTGGARMRDSLAPPNFPDRPNRVDERRRSSVASWLGRNATESANTQHVDFSGSFEVVSYL